MTSAQGKSELASVRVVVGATLASTLLTILWSSQEPFLPSFGPSQTPWWLLAVVVLLPAMWSVLVAALRARGRATAHH